SWLSFWRPTSRNKHKARAVKHGEVQMKSRGGESFNARKQASFLRRNREGMACRALPPPDPLRSEAGGSVNFFRVRCCERAWLKRRVSLAPISGAADGDTSLDQARRRLLKARLFATLGDQNRLRLISRLAAEGPLSITSLGAGLRITRQ